jgi:hypothetical protein
LGLRAYSAFHDGEQLTLSVGYRTAAQVDGAETKTDWRGRSEGPSHFGLAEFEEFVRPIESGVGPADVLRSRFGEV